VDLYGRGEASVIDKRTHDAFGGRGAADVSETDETNSERLAPWSVHPVSLSHGIVRRTERRVSTGTVFSHVSTGEYS
jgi:hypothetical protein